MKTIALAVAMLAFGVTLSEAQDKTPDRPQGQMPASKDSDKALTAAPVGGSGVAGQPSAGGADADSGVSKAPPNPGSRSK